MNNLPETVKATYLKDVKQNNIERAKLLPEKRFDVLFKNRMHPNLPKTDEIFYRVNKYKRGSGKIVYVCFEDGRTARFAFFEREDGRTQVT